ncbi:GntR family transcriptional regulator [Anaerocolumna cellulosilytica]|uniref:GntR family transcriptional regulator n=1 Tax=Anaerocolumna cellulosilytica TaxID=433286 RepID=A0A6S6R6R7_9FIRM|nr:PLP-dependent aminotransferase family protein [Anaerocolumna cellulosilytica]MBB5198039.1 GntR family transcriptional regulator/MocR family aminotransferase [Anaerocolumna cellulosilytica]BCJ95180.1 GntR family transcriptional regulator [Anaerocolumna cellulosilytica]
MLTIILNTASTIPLYEQIYTFIRDEIKAGRLCYRDKLPSTRNLAANLGVSRNTVDMAYAQLLSEGYIESVPKSGYYISMITELTHIKTPPKSKQPQAAKYNQPYLYDFSPFAIDINSFPYNIWRKLSKNCMNESNNDLFLLGDNQGDESLRKAITDYLYSSRGVNCTPEQIIVGAGADYLLQLLAQLFHMMHTERNRFTDIKETKDSITDGYSNSLTIAMENPAYKRAFRIFKGLAFNTVPISLDQNGIKIEELEDSAANLVYVTPSHQYPLGIVMSIKRRLELLQWACKVPNRYIIEDDHDSEFRYKGKPIPALQGIDSNGNVIYLGTFSRAIAPAIRIGYMVLPKRLLALYKKHLFYYSSTVSRMDQYILTHFINDGYFERHLNKIRKLYKNKHDSLIQNLKPFKGSLIIEGENAGLHLVLRLKTKLSEEELTELAAKSGIRLYGLKEHYISHTEPYSTTTFLLGYANMAESEIQKGIQLLYKVLKDYLLP